MADTLTAGARAAADVSALFRARNPLIWIVTREEARAERYLFDAAAAAGYEPRTWDCASGVCDLAGEQVAAERDPAGMLTAIENTEGIRRVWILRDLPRFLSDPFTLRQLRTLVRKIGSAPRDSAASIVVLTPSGEVPPELAGHAVVVEWPLPDRAEIAALLDATIAALPPEIAAAAAPNGTRDAAIDGAIGLTEGEAQACYARSLVMTRKIEPATVAAEKRRVIARERVLEWIEPLPGGLESVGGLENLKAWLKARRAAFTPRARAFGLPAPRGILLAGVPGCGKSMTAKAVAATWGMPLLRLDLGALRSKYVGDSEANIRKALKVAEAVAPCVLWCDEIEKALAGATGGAADGGVSGDALGALLSWLQDRAGAVFAVATANDVRSLPPELSRKGRFDDLFFVDLPTAAERTAILGSALRAHGRTADGLDLQAIAATTAEFTGSEVAALVPDALFAAFAEGERAIFTTDLVRAAAGTVPLARSSAEKITALREWAKGRARPASIPEIPTLNTRRGALDL